MKYVIDNLKKIEMCITSTCNLKCKHCYQHFEKNKFIISKEKIVEIIEYACAHGCEQIILSGGEVFTRKDIYEILDYIFEKKLDLVLVTNGTLIDLEKIKKYRHKNILFQISIDGDEKRHDERRGNGNYKKTINSIKKLKELGFKVKANVTLDNNNYKSIPDIIKNPFFDEVTFLPVANVGAAKLNNFSKSLNELSDCIQMLYRNVPKTRKLCDKCCIFPNGLSINYDGYVYPCSIARDFKIFPMGNINDCRINKIIDNFCKKEEALQFFNYTGNNQIKKCSNCSKNNKCNQGCRMRAFKFFGDMYDCDPFCCKIFNNEYENIDYADLYWGNK